MNASSPIPPIFYRMMRWLNRRLVQRYGPKSKVKDRVLIITTLGRKTGTQRSTPLQFEQVGGSYYVASARGTRADWYRNLVACPEVEVQVADKRFTTQARPILEVSEIADYLELRLKKHPGFMGMMLRIEGLPAKYTRTDLEKLAGRLAIVALPHEKK